ncbi:MAG: outer membrane beta-barrel protein [Methylobacteriaceae bacterium]|nr:outer membrane beta-barrel protein [Methylobacteriaceae bacterium]
MVESGHDQRFAAAALALAAALACAVSWSETAQAQTQDAPIGSPAGGFGLRGASPVALPGGLQPTTFAGNAAIAQAGGGARTPRARAKRPAAVGSARKPLPDLVPYRGAPGQRLRRGEAAKKVVPAPTVAAIPYPERRRVTPEQNPYAPVGVDVGGLRLRPFVEAEGGYDDNPNRASGRKQGSSLARLGAGLEAASDWARHEFKANLRGGYTRYFKVDDADRPDLAATASLRLDATRDTQLLFDAKANLDTQRPGSPEITSLGTRGATLEGRPLVANYGAGVGVTQRFNRLSATLRGAIDRTDYADGDLSDGSKLALGGQSYTTYGLRARLAYEATPGVRPFVEASVDQRRHDERLDQAGFARDSKGATLKAGTSFEITRTLTGEASIGHATRRYDDRRLPDLRGAVVDAALVWTATPLTTITLKASTDLAETNIANASGAIARKASIELSHALLRNLTLTGALALAETDYRGVDLRERSLAATLRADYALTRSIVVRGSFTHERLKSSAVNSDYTANAFLLGLRLQR